MESRLTQKYEFRDIRPEEAEEAIEIEQICFPPNEACSPKSMRERVEKAPELFLVAIDRADGKIAGFLNGIATDEPSRFMMRMERMSCCSDLMCARNTVVRGLHVKS